MADNLIDYKVEQHGEKLKEHDRLFKEQAEKLNSHEKTIVVLAQSIENLVEQLATTNSMVKWFIGIVVTQMLGILTALFLKLF